MIPVSVAIITKNEEKNIGDALKSVADAAEIVVVDEFSVDRTKEICLVYTNKIYDHPWAGYAGQKQIAIDYTQGPWVLVLDADERVTPELAREIEETLAGTDCNGFYIPRKNYFLGKWIKHSGWWPDYTLRLFKKPQGYMEDRPVHEKIVVKGKTGYLKHPLEHHTYRTITEFTHKMERYSGLASTQMTEAGARRKEPGFLSLSLRPLFTFIKMYILRLGLLDGTRGLMLAILYSFYTFLKYAKVWERSPTDRQ